MGFFTQRKDGETDAFQLAFRCLEPFWKPCPAVCEALAGAVDDDGKYIVPPMSIAISVENGNFMFRISSKDADEAFFGTIKDPKQILDSVELALMKGEFKAVPNKYKNTGLAY